MTLCSPLVGSLADKQTPVVSTENRTSGFCESRRSTASVTTLPVWKMGAAFNVQAEPSECGDAYKFSIDQPAFRRSMSQASLANRCRATPRKYRMRPGLLSKRKRTSTTCPCAIGGSRKQTPCDERVALATHRKQLGAKTSSMALHPWGSNRNLSAAAACWAGGSHGTLHVWAPAGAPAPLASRRGTCCSGRASAVGGDRGGRAPSAAATAPPAEASAGDGRICAPSEPTGSRGSRTVSTSLGTDSIPGATPLEAAADDAAAASGGVGEGAGAAEAARPRRAPVSLAGFAADTVIPLPAAKVTQPLTWTCVFGSGYPQAASLIPRTWYHSCSPLAQVQRFGEDSKCFTMQSSRGK